MKHLAKKIFKTLEKEAGELPEEINQNIPDYKEIEDHREAKKVMKDYIENEIDKLSNLVNQDEHPKTTKLIENAIEIINDPKFLEQKGVRSIVDQDARVGHKSRTDHFFGYKSEFIMTTQERIITAVTVQNGAYVDGSEFNKLIDLTMETGLSIKEVYGDKAYFRKSILDKINGIDAKPYIPVSESVYRIDEDKFNYNKDSDEWFCSEGNTTVLKKYLQRKNGKREGKETYKYYFEIEKCRSCNKRKECIKGTNVRKILEIGINTPEFYQYSQEQKSDTFKEKYKNRACHEGKNGEMKVHHRLDRAKGYGLRSMSTQAKLTAIAVNLKRIASILSSKTPNKSGLFLNISIIRLKFCKIILT